jgi:mRNA interferase MazF
MRYAQADILLVSLAFSSQTGIKRRPVMVAYDSGDDDILVAPISSHGGRTSFDVTVAQWQSSGLRLPSVVRVDKLATVEKSAVIRPLGRIVPSDWANVRAALQRLLETILPD